MPATAAAPTPTVSNQVTAVRYIIRPVGLAAAAPTRTSCTSAAGHTTAWRAAASGAPKSWKTGDLGGPTVPGHPRSTTPTILRNSCAGIPTHPRRAGAPGDLVGIHQRQLHRGSREFLGGGHLVELAGVVRQPRCEYRLRRRQRVDRDVATLQLE